MGFGDSFILTLFTNDPVTAAKADAAGVNRIGLDLERLQKQERQAGLKTWISDHEETDLPAIRKVIRKAQLFVRVNPIHSGSKEEIERVLAMGAEVLMLPMFRTVREVDNFIEFVNGRAKVSLLLETAQAMMRVGEIARTGGMEEIFIGLNDLHLSLGLKNHFEILCSPVMEVLSTVVRAAGIRFGFGGIGRARDTSLPVPSDSIYAQYPRLKATSALVSRVFFNLPPDNLQIDREIASVRARMDFWAGRPPEEWNQALSRIREKAMLWSK
jgi:hypothetical protein